MFGWLRLLVNPIVECLSFYVVTPLIYLLCKTYRRVDVHSK
jgi:hypothetical protein